MDMTLAPTFSEGAVDRSNFSDYETVRSDTFQTATVHSLPHPFSIHAADAGEPIAPAIVNGVFRATGQRLRDLPVGPAVSRDRFPREDVPPEGSVNLRENRVNGFVKSFHNNGMTPVSRVIRMPPAIFAPRKEISRRSP
jgi:hypothetical protein